MAMYGEFTHRVDDKGRVILPVSMREILGEKFVIAKSSDTTLNILYLYTRSDWENIIEAGAKIAAKDRSKAPFVRQLSASGKDTELDNQNRVLIPIELRNFAKIEKEVVLLGLGNRVELWNKQAYEHYIPETTTIEESQENADNVAALLEEIAAL